MDSGWASVRIHKSRTFPTSDFSCTIYVKGRKKARRQK